MAAFLPVIALQGLLSGMTARVIHQWRMQPTVTLQRSLPARSATHSTSSASSRLVMRRQVQSSSASSARSRAAVRASLRSSAAARPLTTVYRPAAPAEADFPAFGSAVMPVQKVPNWGVMTSSTEWTKTYAQLKEADFVPLPAYRMSELTIPMDTLADERTPEHVRLITAKLAYSTRYYGRYDLDSAEYEGVHPGIDLKVALGTPIAAIGGGRVVAVSTGEHLGQYVMIEHHLDGQVYFSIYGHVDDVRVEEGQAVSAGDILGIVGMTGSTASPHIHLQIDRDDGVRPHVPFTTEAPVTSAGEAVRTEHPILFIQRHTAL